MASHFEADLRRRQEFNYDMHRSTCCLQMAQIEASNGTSRIITPHLQCTDCSWRLHIQIHIKRNRPSFPSTGYLTLQCVLRFPCSHRIC